MHGDCESDVTETIPERCPTCGTKVPAGATRCPGCGRVFGEDNRCPHCNAIAAVKPAGAGYACTACGKPRERRPGTTVLGEPEPRSSRVSIVPEAATAGVRSGGLRFVGAAFVAGGVAAAALATLILGTGAAGISTALLAGGLAVFLGLRALRRARALDEEARVKERRALEGRILALAQRHEGELTATIVATDLGVRAEEADRALTALVDGQRVVLEVDETDGTQHYVFREARRSAAPRVRAPAADAEHAEAGIDDEAQEAIEREIERVRKRRL